VNCEIENSKEGVVLTWVTQAESTGERDTYASKRHELRITWNASLAVRILDGPNSDQVHYCKAKDVSRLGLSFIARRDIRPDTRVEISADGPDTVNAVVRQSTMTVGSYIIGVEFT
jgi:hypothetical protein